MNYVTEREYRFHAWCRVKGWRPTLINCARWRDMGEPKADPVAGTVLDKMVRRQMHLPLEEVS